MGIENMHIPLAEILEAKKEEIKMKAVNRLIDEAEIEASATQDEKVQYKLYQMTSSAYADVSFTDSSVLINARFADIPDDMAEHASMIESNADVKINALANQYFDDMLNSDDVKNKIVDYVKPIVIEEISNMLGGSAS